jgi:hypothetical protein
MFPLFPLWYRKSLYQAVGHVPQHQDEIPEFEEMSPDEPDNRAEVVRPKHGQYLTNAPHETLTNQRARVAARCVDGH